jgi:hypothetical protein
MNSIVHGARPCNLKAVMMRGIAQKGNTGPRNQGRKRQDNSEL